MPHLLKVPVDEVVTVLHSEQPFTKTYSASVLDKAEAEVAEVKVPREGYNDLTLWFDPTGGMPNTRVRNFIADILHWHMVFNGTVLIDNLTSEEMVKFLTDPEVYR